MNIEAGTTYRLVGLPHQSYDPELTVILGSTTNNGQVNVTMLPSDGSKFLQTWHLSDLEAAIRLGVLVHEWTPTRWTDHGPHGDGAHWSVAERDGMRLAIELLHPGSRGYRWEIEPVAPRGLSGLSGMGVRETMQQCKDDIDLFLRSHLKADR